MKLRGMGLPILLYRWRSPTPRVLDPQARAPCSPLPGENTAIQVRGLESDYLGFFLTMNKLGDLSQAYHLSEPHSVFLSVK